jgi:hypothetical protein
VFAAASRDRSLGIADRVEVLRLGRASSSSLSQSSGTNPTRCPRPAPAGVIVNPLASIVIGATAFGERLRAGTGLVTLDIVAIAVMCAGVVVLVRSPLVAGTSGAAADEYLSARAPDRARCW